MFFSSSSRVPDKTCAEDAPERKVVVRGKVVNASAEAPFAVQHLLKPAFSESCALNSEATSKHLNGPQRGPGAAHQGRSAARTTDPRRPQTLLRRDGWHVDGLELGGVEAAEPQAERSAPRPQ